ncbi:MAG TPA: DUF1552 domain-containing protein [Polyangia bacterium]|jgi:hypothetical protein
MITTNLRTGRGVSRRRFLGGAGVVVGLPFLESLAPRLARAQAAAAAKKRVLYWWMPNGFWMDSFRPTTTGTDYTMPALFTPALDSLRADFSIVTGLENTPAMPDGLGDHASGTSGFITCAHAAKSSPTLQLGISIDQLAVQSVGHLTRVPSLQLGIDGGASAGGCDSGYSCGYCRNISWSDASTPVPKITDPLEAFNTLFRGYDPTASQADIAKRQLYGKSVLDYIVNDAKSLSARLGSGDASKLDQYMTGVRALEVQIAGAPVTATATCPGTPPPSLAALGGMAVSNDTQFTQGSAKDAEANAVYLKHVQAMCDLMVLAIQCDATRIITFMQGNSVCNQTYENLGISGGHHNISHHGGNQTNINQIIKINIWELQQLAYVLTKMKAVSDGTDGSNLLTNSTIFVSSDVSDGNRHNHNDMPVILAGHGGGMLKPGQHVRYGAVVNAPSWSTLPPSSGVPVANMLLTTIATLGITGAKFGNGTGTLPEV